MKWTFVILLALFAYTSANAAREKLTVEACVKSEVDSILLYSRLPADQVKVDQNFLVCLNRIEGGKFYSTLFDVPDELLLARYEFILEARAKK